MLDDLPSWQRYACWWLGFGLATIASALLSGLAGRLVSPLPLVASIAIPLVRGIVLAAVLLPVAAIYTKPNRWLAAIPAASVATDLLKRLLLLAGGSILEANLLKGAVLGAAISAAFALGRRRAAAMIALGATGLALGAQVSARLPFLPIPHAIRLIHSIVAAGALGLAFGGLTGIPLWGLAETEED